ncbi:energy transducer TonB [Polaribacter sp.]|uniref:energy transducer TonB n=1 Tax=Polaribacter sp. TaxID=1920175 RepID=UPI003F6AEE5D
MKSKKKYITIFTLFSILMVFSQSTKKFDYEKYSDPNPENQLSLFFKEHVSKKLLKTTTFFNKDNIVLLSFYVNQQGEPYKLNVSAKGTDEYYTAIKNTFKEYYKKYIGYDSLNIGNKYHLQIISKKGRKIIFNCSSKIIAEKPSICNECKDLDFYEDIKNCLNLAVKRYFYKNANFNLLNNTYSKNDLNLKNTKDIDLFFNQEVDLKISFEINKDGKLINKKSGVPSFFTNEVNRLLSSFPLDITPSTLNNTFYPTKHSFQIKFKKGEKPVFKESNTDFLTFTKPSPSNDFSVYVKSKLTETDLQLANLNRLHNRLSIFFELDKNEQIINLKTNSRSDHLDKKIKQIFKNYPLENLNFLNKKGVHSYTLQVLSFKQDKVVVNTSSTLGYEKAPLFPGCENSKNLQEIKKCFSKNVQLHFSRKFNADLPNRLGLARGKLKVWIRFIIDKNGNATKIATKLSQPSPAIDVEVKRVMSLLPKMASVAEQNGKAVEVKCAIPFTLYIR